MILFKQQPTYHGKQRMRCIMRPPASKFYYNFQFYVGNSAPYDTKGSKQSASGIRSPVIYPHILNLFWPFFKFLLCWYQHKPSGTNSPLVFLLSSASTAKFFKRINRRKNSLNGNGEDQPFKKPTTMLCLIFFFFLNKNIWLKNILKK